MFSGRVALVLKVRAGKNPAEKNPENYMCGSTSVTECIMQVVGLKLLIGHFPEKFDNLHFCLVKILTICIFVK